MAGTYAEQAALAVNNAFVDKCRVAMLSRSAQLLNASNTKELVRQQMLGVLRSAAADSPNMAWRVAVGSPSIAAAAPSVPNDIDVQNAVNFLLDML